MTRAAVPSSIYSPSDLTALILEMRSYSKWFGQYVNAQRVGSKHAADQPELSTTAADLLRQYVQLAPLTVARLDELVASLEHAAAHAPVATITLAAPASSEVKQAITDWCRRELSPNILITFRFNAHILGGMVVRVGSHMFDWSFRTSLMNHRHGFTEVLSRV